MRALHASGETRRVLNGKTAGMKYKGGLCIRRIFMRVKNIRWWLTGMAGPVGLRLRSGLRGMAIRARWLGLDTLCLALTREEATVRARHLRGRTSRILAEGTSRIFWRAWMKRCVWLRLMPTGWG